MTDQDTTRVSLHAVAEFLLAGPQYDQHQTIRLRVTPGGFATVAGPDLRVEGTAVVVGTRHVGLHGRSIPEVAAELGVTPYSLAGLYPDGSGVSMDHTLRLDAGFAAKIEEAFQRGQEALTIFAPEVDAVLWPEHFDLGIAVDEVNYGVSAGDKYLAVPYAYVGPWSFPAAGFGADPTQFTGPFWNAPFGAARPVAQIDNLVGFMSEGRALAAAATH